MSAERKIDGVAASYDSATAETSTASTPSTLSTPTTKKAYRPPGLSVYGRIERTTGGGSGMAKESFAMETFRFP